MIVGNRCHRSQWQPGATGVLIFGWVLLVSCQPIGVGIEVGVEEKTRQTLDQAIEEIGEAPQNWKEVVKSATDDLRQLSSQASDDASQLVSEALASVEATYSRAIGQTESAAFCSADFVGHRVEQRLQQIRAELFGGHAPELVPVVCLVEPQQIEAGKTTLVSYYGYDFLEFAGRQNFTADLEYSTGEIVRAGFGQVAVTSDYLLQVDIQAVDFSGVEADRGPQLVLKWGAGGALDDQGRQSQLPVLIPRPANLSLISVAASPVQSFTNQPVQVVAVIGNTGSQPAGNFRVTWETRDGQGPESLLVSRLDPGQTQTVLLEHAFVAAGVYTTLLQIDPDNQVDEVDETDNNQPQIVEVVKRRAQITVAFTRAHIINDANDCGGTDLWLHYTVNELDPGWVNLAGVHTASMYSLELFVPDERRRLFTLTLAEDEPLVISVSGTGDHGGCWFSGDTYSFSPIVKTYADHTSWAGIVGEQTLPEAQDRSFKMELLYNVSVNWLP